MNRPLASLFVAAQLIGACIASAGDVTILKKLPRRKYPCDFEIYDSQNPPPRPYEKVAIFAISGHPVNQTPEDAAMESFREAACKAGVDAVIIRDQERGRIDAVGIVFTKSNAEPQPTIQPGNLDSGTWADKWRSMSHVDRFHFGNGVQLGLWAAGFRFAAWTDRLEAEKRTNVPECRQAERLIDAGVWKGVQLPTPEDLDGKLDEFYSHPENARVDFGDAVASLLLKAEGLPGAPNLRDQGK